MYISLKVTTHYTKKAKNTYKDFFFSLKSKIAFAKCPSPPQELEVGPRSPIAGKIGGEGGSVQFYTVY